MTDEQINKAIHSVVSGCDHDWEVEDVDAAWPPYIDCRKCHEIPINFLDPDQPHSQVVKMVTAFMDKYGGARVHDTLSDGLSDYYPLQTPADRIARALATLVEDTKDD